MSTYLDYSCELCERRMQVLAVGCSSAESALEDHDLDPIVRQFKLNQAFD